MAHMYPESGPVVSTGSSAERRIYDLLKDKLDDEYWVFHSVRWVKKERNGSLTNGEIDFVIVHQERGILVVEVKGGRIDIDGRQWKSVDRADTPNDIDDPFQQSENAAHSLKNHLTAVASTKPFRREYWVEYAVWFPNTTWQPGAVPLPHVHDDLVLDIAAMQDPEPVIRAIMTSNKRKHPLTPAAFDALKDVLAPKRTIKAKLSDQIKDEETEFIRLRDDQYRKLVLMDHFPRVAVRGAAGTGKTVIALEKARQLAEQRLDVLFVCSNRSLARWLLGMVREESEEIQAHLTVHNVEQLTTELSGQAQLLLNEPSEQEAQLHEELGNRTFQVKLAADFMRSISALEAKGQLPTYDAILVDEGQDFERPLWGPLYKLLRDRRNGRFIAFYDPAQRDGDGDGTPSIPGGGIHELFLTENCRNTQAVFDLSQRFYLGLELPACIGPAGDAVEWFDPETQAPASDDPEMREVLALEMVLDKLVDGEGVSPRDILVIIGRPQKASKIYRRRSIGKHLLSNNTGIQDPNIIRVATVRTVKGLESRVVVLVELDGIQKFQPTTPRAYYRYMYVATSRAMHHLIVIGIPEKLLPKERTC